MFEYRNLSERCSYIDSPAKIGLIHLNETDKVLIDSGGDKDAGRKIRKLFDEKGWILKAIINTHSNADHIGGNEYLQKQTGCSVYASEIEQAFTEHPVLEPSFLYGGYPFKDLRHKFLLAKPSRAQLITQLPAEYGIEWFALPGHFFNMIGLKAPDGTVFLADSLASEQTLQKYGIPFIYDVQAYLETIDEIEKMDAPLYVPSHAPVSEDIRPLCRVNRDKVFEIEQRILGLLDTPKSFEQILAGLFRHYSLKMDAQQYVLVGSTIRSFLSWMKDRGKLAFAFDDSVMLWKRKEE